MISLPNEVMPDSQDADLVSKGMVMGDSIKRHWTQRYTLAVVIAALIIFPLFYGGRHNYACGIFEFLIYSLAACISAYLLGKKDNTKFFARSGFYLPFKPILLLLIAFGILVMFQSMVLPSGILHYFSPNSFELYRLAGVDWGYISLEPSTTASEFYWYAAIVICGAWLVSLPQETYYTVLSSAVFSATIESKSSRQESSLSHRSMRSGNPFFMRARSTDYVADMLQSAVVYVGTLCSVIAIVHWALRAELLFGLFDPGRGGSELRAHWPFVNPDHLSVLLEISIISAFARLLRLNQLQQLKGNSNQSDNLALRILQSPGKLGRQLPYALALLTMILCNVLTLSRAGNVLSFLGMTAIFVAFQRFNIRPKLAAVGARHRKAHQPLVITFWTRLALKLLAFGGLTLLILFFLGQTGRDITANRIEYGLASAYDQSRQELNAASWSVFLSYPLFGVGLGCWHLAATQHFPRSLAGWTISYAHNDYLQILAETGLIGGLLVCSIIILLFRETRKAWRQELMATERLQILGSLTAILLPMIHAVVDFPLHIPAISLVFSVAIVIHLRYLQRAIKRPV